MDNPWIWLVVDLSLSSISMFVYLSQGSPGITAGLTAFGVCHQEDEDGGQGWDQRQCHEIYGDLMVINSD